MGKEALCVLNFSQTLLLLKTILLNLVLETFIIFCWKVISHGNYKEIVPVLISEDVIEISNDYICIGLSNLD